MNKILLIFLFSQLAHAHPLDSESTTAVAQVLPKPWIRSQYKERSFAHEYAQIQKRRAYFGIGSTGSTNQSGQADTSIQTTLPNKILGLGLSGGGVKSTAFQLGLLAGLQQIKSAEQSASLLDRVDYMSAVSGGGWAAGAFWAWPKSSEIFFNCLNAITATTEVKNLSNECQALQSVLTNQQKNVISRNKWRSSIEHNYLLDHDVNLAQAHSPEYSYLDHKPYLILNATHSNTLAEGKSPKNFPFEITRDQIGTVADCNSDWHFCGPARRLRWINLNNFPRKGFFIDLDELNQGLHVAMNGPIAEGQKPGFYLSHAMATSSGLIAKLISWHMNLDFAGTKIPHIRSKYVLSDGGKTDNLGALSLIERGTDLMVLSHASADPELQFDDLYLTQAQTKKLFKGHLNIFNLLRPFFANEELTELNPNYNSAITHSHYVTNSGEIKQVILVKPTPYNIIKFKEYLQGQENYQSIYNYLAQYENDENNRERFPQNPTLQFSYPRELIFAYFLLGEFIAREELAAYINAWLLE